MALPISRNTTYSASTEVKSADLNDLQDMIVSGRHGEYEVFLPSSYGMSEEDTSLNDIGVWTNSANAIARVYFPIVIPVGAVITQVKTYFGHVVGATAINVVSTLLYRAVPGDTRVTIATVTQLTASGNNYTSTVYSGTTTTVTGRVYEIEVDKSDAAASTLTWYGASYKYRK
jgi:hypothetical protein